MHARSFLSDNAAPVHDKVMEALVNCNRGHEPAYGEDKISQRMQHLFREQFGTVSTFLMLTGTAANVVALQSVVSSVEAVICADSAHLHLDECGAPEKFIGCKILTAKTTQGKLSAESVLALLQDGEDVHRSKPTVLSLAQPTEWGTVYTPQELSRLSELCRQRGLWLHMDGARLANAAAALNLTLGEASFECGVDLLSLGGTKNGLMGAEAIVIRDQNLASRTAAYRKQAMQLASKMRYVAAQFTAYFEDQLWRQLATHANKMAALLANELKAIPEVVMAMPVESNAVFARIPRGWIAPLQAKFLFSVWDEKQSIVRWMTAYDTRVADVHAFVSAIKSVSAEQRD